eukprot:TRINITY_DN5068_c0_g3_i1.p1 TRINITY_DN5068_c0_g3~~TRINITY_DN5068_c0_g3_i1.p1  ORF type:complete len:438 (-),score=48.19 TRINITY_DN5068_c0_g3_i1:105-1418(-)
MRPIMKHTAVVILGCLGFSAFHAVKVSSQAEVAVSARSGMPSPWLSLLANSWTLAGSPPSQKESTLKKMAEDIVKLAKNADLKSDPSMVTAVNSIRSLLDDMIGSINSTNLDAQTGLDDKADAVIACQAPAVPAQPHMQTPRPQPTQTNVTNCRGQQQTIENAYEACLALQSRCRGNTLCCDPVIQPEGGHGWCNETPKPSFSFGAVSLCYSAPSASQCSITQLSTELAYWQGLLNQYDQKVTACENAMTGCPTPPGTPVDCTAQHNALIAKRGECDTIQQSFENLYCTYAANVETPWDNYTTCYNTNSVTLTTAETAEHTNLPNRQQQYRAILRIECLLDVLVGNSADMTAALEACINARYDVSSIGWLNISYPTNSPTFPALQTCTTQMWEPGSAVFNTYFYNNHSLISDALTETRGCVGRSSLQHCPMRTTTTG